MHDFTPQYAPDLEWMLQSGQVPRELLLEALLQEYYTPVYHLALSILDDHAAAQAAAGQTFARALLDQHRYRSEDGVDFWLFRIALDACQRFHKRLQFRRSLKATLPRWSQPRDFGDSCPETLQDAQLWLALDGLELHTRRIVLLDFASGWQPERIAALLGLDETEVETALAAARTLVAAPPQLDPELPVETALHLEQVDACLVASLARRWPSRQFSPAELQAQSASILRQLRWLGFRQTKALAALELGLLALIILLAFAAIWGANFLYAARSTGTPEVVLATHLVTKLVYQALPSSSISGAPARGTSSHLLAATARPTSTPIQVVGSSYTVIDAGETLQDVANRLGVSIDDLRYWNRLPRDAEIRAGQRLINPQYTRSLQPVVATPVDPSKLLPTLQAPISGIAKLTGFLYQGLNRLSGFWLDASIIDYGPKSYIGPSHILRKQAWVNKSQALVLSGPYAALPDEARLVFGYNRQFLARPVMDTPWFSEWRAVEAADPPAEQSIDSFAEISLFNPYDLSFVETVRELDREDVAGQSCIKFDLFDRQGNRLARLWVDDSLGKIMRRINYYPGQGDVSSTEYVIHAISLDVDFPQQLFDLRLPWRGGFAQDYRAAPLDFNAPSPDFKPRDAIRSGKSAPADLDLSHSQLTFQYAGSDATFNQEEQYEVFAGQYFIGQAYFGDPWSMICDRSSDGRWLAYASRAAQSQDPGSMLHWFDLSEPAQRFFTLYNQTGISELAFSPDSRRLAFFSPTNPLAPGALSILNLPYQNVRQIYTTGDLRSLAWSPDGKSLAFIDRADPSSPQENILVISAEDGTISYNTPLGLQRQPAQEWPMATWGVDFPVEMGGMDACAAPPGS